ncbi:MAG: hypothetical protein ACTSPB_10360 [Candidatus Thorarchaeota archaeon]
MSLNEMAKEVHEIAVEKGWWDEPRTFAELVALMHCELSEALEAFRDGKPGATIIKGKPEGYIVELVDCMIRILDTLGHEGVDVDRIYQLKVKYNKTRSYRHGGKRL